MVRMATNHRRSSGEYPQFCHPGTLRKKEKIMRKKELKVEKEKKRLVGEADQCGHWDHCWDQFSEEQPEIGSS